MQHLFNYSLLLRRECCSFSNGEFVKAGLDELEHWCFWLTDEVITPSYCFNKALRKHLLTFFTCNCKQYAGSAWDELKHIRQAVTLLILEEKHSRSLTEITDDFCPVSFWTLQTTTRSSYHHSQVKLVTKSVLFCGTDRQVLSMQQLYRISTMYCDDKYGTLGIPPEVSQFRHIHVKNFQSSTCWLLWLNSLKTAGHLKHADQDDRGL